jgi:tetratricopeptide (TPR) repeat protein
MPLIDIGADLRYSISKRIATIYGAGFISTKDSDVEKNIQRVRNAFENGQHNLAKHLATHLLSDEPEHGAAWEYLGLIQYLMGEYEDAVNSLERASLFVPLKLVGHIRLAIAYGKMQRIDLARDLLMELTSHPRVDPAALLEIARGFDGLDLPHLAMKTCRQASAIDSQLAQPYYDLGCYAARAGYPAHVTANLARQAVSLDPENIEYRLGLTSVWVKMGQQKRAYSLMKGITEHQIQLIRCECCLQRLIDLFRNFKDQSMFELCLSQLDQVKSLH